MHETRSCETVRQAHDPALTRRLFGIGMVGLGAVFIGVVLYFVVAVG